MQLVWFGNSYYNNHNSQVVWMLISHLLLVLRCTHSGLQSLLPLCCIADFFCLVMIIQSKHAVNKPDWVLHVGSFSFLKVDMLCKSIAPPPNALESCSNPQKTQQPSLWVCNETNFVFGVSDLFWQINYWISRLICFLGHNFWIQKPRKPKTQNSDSSLVCNRGVRSLKFDWLHS